MDKDTVAVVVGGKVLTFLVPAAFIYRGKTYLLQATDGKKKGLLLTRPQKDLISND